jgi:hypothetical protein
MTMLHDTLRELRRARDRVVLHGDRIICVDAPLLRRLLPRLVFVAAVVLASAFAPAPAHVRFIRPKARVVLAPGGTVVDVSLHVEPLPANRWLVIEWCDGRQVRELHGADDAATQPPDAPLHARVSPGRCPFVATTVDANGKQLDQAVFELTVCGLDGCPTEGDDHR